MPRKVTTNNLNSVQLVADLLMLLNVVIADSFVSVASYVFMNRIIELQHHMD